MSVIIIIEKINLNKTQSHDSSKTGNKKVGNKIQYHDLNQIYSVSQRLGLSDIFIILFNDNVQLSMKAN